jgi:hypothetical protein
MTCPREQRCLHVKITPIALIPLPPTRPQPTPCPQICGPGVDAAYPHVHVVARVLVVSSRLAKRGRGLLERLMAE